MVLLRIFILKPTERAQVLLKNGARDFQNSPRFERSACFYVKTSESFKRFQCFNFEKKFLEKNWSIVFQLKPLRLKTHHFHSTLLCQNPVLSEDKQNGDYQKWTYHKEWSFSSNYFIFLDKLFQFQNLLKRVNLMHQRPKCPYSYFL